MSILGRGVCSLEEVLMERSAKDEEGICVALGVEMVSANETGMEAECACSGVSPEQQEGILVGNSS
jgi:hypothetical protein